jgi:hypothetical protein
MCKNEAGRQRHGRADAFLVEARLGGSRPGCFRPKCDISVLQTVIIVFCLLRLLVASRSIEWLCYKQRQYDHP